MNKHAILHIPDSRYCFPISEHELVLRLRMAKEDRDCAVYLVSAPKYDFWQTHSRSRLSLAYEDDLFIYYETHLTLDDVRFAYIFQLEENGQTWYYSEKGVTETYNYKEAFYDFFQMPYINANDVMPVVDWMRGAVFYQVFVERFRIGDTQKDTSYINMKWGVCPTPKSFAGGDLQGILEKLDYIAGLGVTVLYLTPIFTSISNHKYDISDYYQIDPHFGDTQTLILLVSEAHRRGMRVVLDAVFNHCSSRMQQFADVLEHGSQSRYYDWFLIHGQYPDAKKSNYECFAACNYMPKLNTANPEVQQFLLDIGCYWIREADIDGWRLDVADEVSHDFWRQFRKAIKTEKPDAVLIGENWHDAYAYLMGDQYDSIMNYSFTKACLDYFAKDELDAAGMAHRLAGNYMRNTEPVNYMMLNLLDSHDTHRFYSEVGCRKNRLIAALALEMIYPGAACIYYGTEIPIEGGYDPDSRRCFPWEDVESDANIITQVRALTALRQLPVIQYGTLQLAEENGMLCVRRIYEDTELRLYINMTPEAILIPFTEINETEEIRNAGEINKTPSPANSKISQYVKREILSENNYHTPDQLDPEGYIISIYKERSLS